MGWEFFVPSQTLIGKDVNGMKIIKMLFAYLRP